MKKVIDKMMIFASTRLDGAIRIDELFTTLGVNRGVRALAFLRYTFTGRSGRVKIGEFTGEAIESKGGR